MSCSNPNMKCKEYVMKNFPQNPPTHWFKTIDDQLKGAACCLHSYSQSGCMGFPHDIDLLMAGGPCHPYSTQRAGRFKSSSVEDHFEYAVTFDSLADFLRTAEPRACISEQVAGFDKPIEKGSVETPLQRPVNCSFARLISGLAATVSGFCSCLL